MIRSATDGAVTTVTIDRPRRRNALDHASLSALLEALQAAREARTRVVVLSGADGNFCAGADIDGVDGDGFVAVLAEVLTLLTEMSCPTMAAVEGFALGAGTQLAAACDLRIATPDATFGIPAAKLGLMVDQWTVRRLARVAGEGPARAMLLAAETYSGEQCAGFGFVQRLGGVADAHSWAERIAALAPLTVAGHKLGLNEAERTAPVSDLYREAFERAWKSDDLREGRDAFADKRAPVFRGS